MVSDNVQSAGLKDLSMPIFYEICKDDNLIKVQFVGKITDKEMLDAYTEILQHEDWSEPLNELTDLSQLNAVDISFEGIQQLSDFIEDTLTKRGARPKMAIYAPGDLAYGLARVYTVKSETFEDNRVFRNLENATKWLLEN